MIAEHDLGDALGQRLTQLRLVVDPFSHGVVAAATKLDQHELSVSFGVLDQQHAQQARHGGGTSTGGIHAPAIGGSFRSSQ